MKAVVATVGHASTNGTPPEAADTEFERHRADALKIDPRVERVAKPRHVKRLANNLDLDALGVVTLSRRSNGDLVLLDGMHRTLALRQIGFGEWELRCHVYEGLTLEQEAALFRKLNDADKPSAVDDFLVGVTERDGECVVIHRACKRHGFEVARQKADGNISCVRTLRGVYGGKGSRAYPKELDTTLATIVAAWGHTTSAVEGHVVGGLGEFFKTYGDEIELDVLVTKLAKASGGPSGLLGRARTWQEIHGGTIKRCMAMLLVDLYNQGRRKNRLAPL